MRSVPLLKHCPATAVSSLDGRRSETFSLTALPGTPLEGRASTHSMRCRALLAALVIWGVAFGSPAAHAQAVTTTPSSWTLDVGMSFSPWFGTYADRVEPRLWAGRWGGGFGI